MIKSIQLTNFRNHEAFQAKLTKRVLITGPNGSGKSSVVDALAWVLTGRCRGVDGRGVGQKDLIRNGADDMGVSVDLGGIGPITRGVSRTGAATVSLKNEMITGKLRVSDTTLHAVLYGRHFFQLHHAEAKKMLMALLNVQINPADLPGLDLDGPVGLDELEARYLAAFEDRKTQRKVLADIVLPDFLADPVLDKQDLDILKAEASGADDQMRKAMQRRATAQGKVDSLLVSIDRLKKDLDGRVKVQTQLETHQDLLSQHRNTLATVKKTLADAEAEPGEAIIELQGQVNAKEQLVSKLKTHAPDRGCVLSASIPCLTAASAFKDQVDGLVKEIKTLGRKVTAGTKRQEGIVAARQRVIDAEREVTYHSTQVDKHTGQLKDLDTRAGDLDTLQMQLAAAYNSPDLPQEPVDQAADDAKAAQQKANALRDYLQSKKYVTQVAERQLAQATKVDRLETLVDLLGPNGVRGQALQLAVAEFEDLINAALEPFGFTLAFQVEPFQVDVASKANGRRRYEMLSAGEQLWTGLAFQVALAVVSGLGFCVLDAAEAVVGENRALLTDLIMTAPVDQVVVAMAKGDDEQDPDIPGLQVIRLAGVASAVA